MKKLFLLLLFLIPFLAIAQTEEAGTIDLDRDCYIRNDTLFCYGDTLVGFSDSAGFIERVYWVGESKLAMTPTGSINAPFATIQDAIDAAPSNSVIYVAPGTYNEHLEITEDSITIKSIGGKWITFINVLMVSSAGINVSDHTVIDGFTIYGEDAGFLIELASNENKVTIINCKIDLKGSPTMGISVGANGCDSLYVYNNVFKSESGDGNIWLNKTNTNVVIDNNIFIGADSTSGYAIQAAGINDARFTNNVISGMASGIFVHTVTSGTAGSYNVLIEGNVIKNCGKGVRLGHSSMTVNMDSITVFSNVLYQNSFGIYIENNAQVLSGTFFIIGNDLIDNKVPIRNAGTAPAYSANIINGGATFSGALVSNTIELSAGTSANEISTDVLLAGDSDDAIPTEHAVKTYIDNADDLKVNVADSNLSIEGNYTTTLYVDAADDLKVNVADSNLSSEGNYTTTLYVDAADDLKVNIADSNLTSEGNYTTTLYVNTADDLKVNIADSNKTSANNYATTLYVNNLDDAQDLDFAGDAGTSQVLINSETFTFSGTPAEIETSASGQTLTIGLPDSIDVDTYTESGINVVNYSELQSSLVGAYYWLNGIDAAINGTANAALNFGNSDKISIVYRFKSDLSTGIEPHYLGGWFADGSNSILFKYPSASSSTNPSLRVEFNNAVSEIVITEITCDIEWNIIVITIDGTVLKTYLNGVLIATDAVTDMADCQDVNGKVRLGESGGTFYSGNIASVQIFNYILPDIKAIEGSTWSSDNPPIWWSDVEASQTPIYTSDFTAGVDNWDSFRGTIDGNIDGISDGGTSKDNVLRFYADENAVTTHIFHTGTNDPFTVGKRYRVAFDVYIPSSNTNVDGFGIKYSQASAAPYIGGWGTSGSGMAFSNLWTSVIVESVTALSVSGIDFQIIALKGSDELFVGTNVNTDDLIYVVNVVITPIGVVANYNGSGIGHNTWSDASGNDLFGTVSGAIWTNIPNNATQKVRQDNLTGDTQILSSDNIVPNGWKLVSIIGTETAGNTAILDCGTSASGTQIFTEQTFTASTNNPFEVNYYNFSGSDQAVYVHDDSGGSDWNSAELNFVFYLIKIK